jgi:predicted RNase H-like HicB family nuclease
LPKVHYAFGIESEPEEDGRWLAEVLELPGVLAYGHSESEARAKAQALALRVIAEQFERGERGSELVTVSP